MTKVKRYFLCLAVFWLVVGVLPGQDTATGGAGYSQSAQVQVSVAHRSLQLTATVIGQEYCRNTALQRSQMALKLKLSVRNVSNATLLVCRYCNSIHRVALSQSLEKADSGEYVYDQKSTVRHLPFPESNDTQLLAPADGVFVTLKPGESFDYPYPQSVDITLGDAADQSLRVVPGQYFLQVKIETWDWDREKRKLLEQRWAQTGSLFYWDVASEPLAISIEKPKSTTACKTP